MPPHAAQLKCYKLRQRLLSHLFCRPRGCGYNNKILIVGTQNAYTLLYVAGVVVAGMDKEIGYGYLH